jgi:dienelactone hydrolase
MRILGGFFSDNHHSIRLISFFNDQGRNYDAKAAQDSWQRVLAFFKGHIGS